MIGDVLALVPPSPIQIYLELHGFYCSPSVQTNRNNMFIVFCEFQNNMNNMVSDISLLFQYY